MAGHHPWSRIEARFNAEQLREIDEEVGRLRQEMFLYELRELAGMTQTELADEIGVKQASVSKMEQQDDMQIGTLRKIVEALGGELEITAHLPKARISIRPFSRHNPAA